jgi:hypothetical protein
VRLRVVHWNAKEAEPLLESLRAAGHSVELTSSIGSGIMKYLRAAPPEAVVIDLSRQPSHGREVGAAIRNGKTIKHLPILYVDGDPEKVAGIRTVLPDAVYTTRARVIAELKRAKPVANPVRPTPMMERFGNRTTAQKLGIGKGMRVAVLDPPADYERAIGALPEGAVLEENPREVLRLTLWFTHDPDSFLARMRRMRALAAQSRLWILWRKNKVDGLDGGFIRVAGIDAGLVDYKICSVDAVWSGMAFAVKKISPKKP